MTDRFRAWRYPALLLAATLGLGALARPGIADTLPRPVPLTILWRIVLGASQRVITADPRERDGHPLDGQLFYVARARLASPTSLAELLMPSPRRCVSCTDAAALGFVWTTGGPGLSPLVQAIAPGAGDRTLTQPGETLAGYVDEAIVGWGYPRALNSAERLLSLSAGGVTIQSNAVAGGALWRWFWNGTQFVNSFDYGREIQSALFYQRGDGEPVENPTEAGDGHSRVTVPPARRHGSPLLLAENVETTQTTRAIPLEWNPEAFGGDADHPVLHSRVVIGKDVTLDFAGMGPVARYRTALDVPAPIPGAMVEIPTGYLRAEFRRFWTVDAEANAVREVTPPSACRELRSHQWSPGYGGVIVGNATGTHAMGVYGVQVALGGSVSYFTLWDFVCANAPADETSFNTVKWSAVFGTGAETVPAGTSVYTTYIVTDTVRNVARAMRRLYLAGVR